MKKIVFRKCTWLVSVLLCMALIITYMPLTMQVYAEEAGASGLNVQGSKTASPTKLKEDRKTTVTLAMPSGEYQNKIDIVFVMDNSTSVANSGYNFADNVERLFDSIIDNNPGIDMKVAVVKFRGYATDMLGSGLTKYQGNEDAILNAIRNNTVPGSGSNAHSGLVKADKLLEADTDVEAANKYVVFLTDGKNYIWNNDSDEPVCYYMQYAEKTTVKNDGKPSLNQKAGIYNKEQGNSYSVPQITSREVVNFIGSSTTGLNESSAYYQRVFDSTNSELSSTSTKYDEPCYYTKYYDSYTGNATVGDGTVVKRTLTNGSSIFNINGQQSYRDFYDYTPAENTFWKDIDYLQLNPYNVVYNEEDGTYSYDENSINDDFFLWHPDGFQKGTYQAGHYWKDKIVAKYNAASVSYDPKSGGGTNLAGSFHHWLLENSDYSADIKDSDDVSAMFADIDNSIRYMVGNGVVTDKIADEFTLDMPSGGESPFRMTYDGTSLSAASGGDNTWNFGTAGNDGKYPYVVQYDESSKTITWTINVPIENLKQITLSYDLILGEEYPSGTYDTNESAVLIYTSSDGKYTDQKYVFEKPKVEYKKPVKIIYDLNGGEYNGSSDDIIEMHEIDEVITIHEAPVRDGYVFQYWEGSMYDPGDSYKVEGEHTFTAVWEPDTADDEEDGDDSGKPKTGDRGFGFELAATIGSAIALTAMLAVRRRKREQE